MSDEEEGGNALESVKSVDTLLSTYETVALMTGRTVPELIKQMGPIGGAMSALEEVGGIAKIVQGIDDGNPIEALDGLRSTIGGGLGLGAAITDDPLAKALSMGYSLGDLGAGLIDNLINDSDGGTIGDLTIPASLQP